MYSYLKLVQSQLKLFMREPVALFFTIAFPTVLLVFLGLIFGNGNEPFEGATFGYIDIQLPALSGMILGTVALVSLPVATANNREQGIFRRFKATPMPAWQWIAAEFTVYYLLALASMLILIAIGVFFFNMRVFGNLGAIFLGFTLCAFSFMAFGYLIASLTPTARIATAVGQAIYLPMFFLSGAAFPIDLMPAGMKAFAQWLPMTHVVLLMQGLWLEGDWVIGSVWVLIGVGVIGAMLSSRLFRWE